MILPKEIQPASLRIFVVEDHPLVAEGIRLFLGRQPGLEFCGTAPTMADALTSIRTLAPDLVLLDVLLKDGNGLQLIAPLKAEFPNLQVLVLTQFEDTIYAEQALRAGAGGYVTKEEAPEELLRAIESVARGEVYVTRRIATRLVHTFINLKSTVTSEREHLSNRELQVLQLLGAAMSTREIAAELQLSIKTIETYREHLKYKLGLANGAELSNYAMKWLAGQKLLNPPGSAKSEGDALLGCSGNNLGNIPNQ
jgi:DNA-binding NarL/FixJ family response regulator